MSNIPITKYHIHLIDDRLTYPRICSFDTVEELKSYTAFYEFIPFYEGADWLGGYYDPMTGDSFIIICDFGI